MSTLNLFPARVPTGWFRGPDGKNVDVFATPEFFRALSAVFDRIGGTNGIANDELALFTILAPVASIAAPDVADLEIRGAEQSAQLHGLARAMEEIQLLAASVSSLSAEVRALRQSQASDAIDPGYQDQYRVNWERPGKIGALTANSGAFTTLSASAAVALSPASANVVLSPTGTGLVTINPATTGALDNVVIGAGTAKAVTCTALTATGAAALSPANANVVLAPTGTGLVTINPATLGSMDKVAIGATTPSTGAFTTVAATSTITAGAGITSTSAAQHGLRALGGLVSGGKTYANFLAGPAQAFHESGQLGYVYDSGTPANSFFHLTPYGVAEGSTFKSDTAGNTTIAGAFGCNTKAAQSAAASGGALAAYGAGANGLDTGANMSALHALVVSIRAALVANGIMS